MAILVSNGSIKRVLGSNSFLEGDTTPPPPSLLQSEIIGSNFLEISWQGSEGLPIPDQYGVWVDNTEIYVNSPLAILYESLSVTGTNTTQLSSEVSAAYLPTPLRYTYRIVGLSTNTSYDIKIIAKRKRSVSDFSSTLSISTSA